MNKFSENYKIDSLVKSMLDIDLVDYATAQDKITSTMYPLSKVASKKLYQNLGMKSKQFSKNLYDVDILVWRELVAKKFNNQDVLDWLVGHKAIILDNEIINITDDTDVLTKFIRSANELLQKATRVEYEYSDTDKVLSILGLAEDKVGLLVRFYLQEDYVEVHECFMDESGLLNISPFKVVSTEVHSEDIDIVMNNESLWEGLNLIKDEGLQKDYNKRLCNPMSVDELGYYTKRYLKYKLDSEKQFDPQALIEGKDLSYETSVKLEVLATKINNTSDEVSNVYYSNYLKKSITMTEVTFGNLADALWGLIKDNALGLQVLIDLFNDMMRGKCHYMYINN